MYDLEEVGASLIRGGSQYLHPKLEWSCQSDPEMILDPSGENATE
jgi:hypothetical protein